MSITQEQFNNIINLLGLAANADATYQAKENTGMHDSTLKQQAQEALDCYLKAVTQLYNSDKYPTVYLDAFNNKGGASHTSNFNLNGRINTYHVANAELTHLIYVGGIVDQLNKDFSSEDVNNKLTYTGAFKYVTYARETIQSETATFYKNRLDHQDALTPSFMMQVLSHSATLIVGAILLLAGIAAYTTGTLSGGIALASVGGMMIAGYGCSKLGLFTENTDTSASSDPFATTRYQLGQP